MKTLKFLIKTLFPFYRYILLWKEKFLCFFISDEKFISKRYKKTFGRTLDLKNPQSLNEKILWRMLYDQNPLFSKLTDKFLVRDYVKEKIGEDYLIPLLGVYNSVAEIDYDKLPNRFVLKCTHDCGSVVICKDKSTFDKKAAHQKLRFCLKRNFYLVCREKHYKNIQPRIIAEEFIGGNESPTDYKFYMFKTNFHVQINEDRYNKHSKGFFDKNYHLLPVQKKSSVPPKNLEKPLRFETMITLAQKLSSDFDFVRVDLYNCNGKIFFGELTFTPAAGNAPYLPDEWDYTFGKMWQLPIGALDEKS